MQCLHRWQKVLDPALCKGPWTPEARAAAAVAAGRGRAGWRQRLTPPRPPPPPQEDVKILAFVKQYGVKSWAKIAGQLPGRIGKQCRERCARPGPGAGVGVAARSR